MRKEILEIIEKNKSDANQLDLIEESYPIVTEEDKHNWELMAKKQEMLIASIQSHLTTASIHVGTSTSIEIEWTEPTVEIVIELSLEGNLASMFSYGDVSQETLNYIDKCLQSNNLLRLLDEEIVQLENEGMYRQIF
jgi:hypothetical protein